MTFCEDRLSCIYALFWVGLIWFVIIPFEIYATINMFKYRYHPGVQSRYPIVVMASAIFAILHALFCEQFYYLSSGVNIDTFHIPPIPYTLTLIFPPLFFMMMIIIIFRIYLLHYSINYAVAQSARSWQSLLSTSVSANDFYSHHQSTYGNCKYVSRYFIGYAIIGSLMEICITIYDHHKLLETSHSVSQMVYMFWNYTLVVFVGFLFLKTPKFEDVYFLRKEMKYLLYFGSFCLILYTAMISLISDEYRIFEQISTSVITLFNFGWVVISEYIVLNKMIRPDERFDYGVLKSNMIHKKLSLIRNQIGKSLVFHQKKRGSSSRQLFNVLIASSVGINYFVRHLQSEFSMENVLCFIELIQWIYNVTNKEFAIFDITPFSNIEFELSTAIPISSANQQSNDNQWDWKQSISAIFKKYIHSSAEYQVNLPFEIQTAFANLIHLINIKEQTANGSYTFQHKPNIKKSPTRFWNSTLKMDTVNTVAITKPSTTVVSYNIKTFQERKKEKLFPNSSAPNPTIKKEMNDDKAIQRFKSLHGNEGSECADDIYQKHGLEVVDELVVLDDGYLSGDEYADPDILDFNDVSYTSTKSSDICIDNGNEEHLIDIHLEQKTSTFSVASSLTKSLRNISSRIRGNSKSNKGINEEYLKELQMIHQAKNLTIFDFVTVSCRVLHIILQLNYQSVIRFKRSQQYTNMLDAINLEQLIHKYGEKGVS